jgi:alkyl hydroperoxide reductase subunit AhpC
MSSTDTYVDGGGVLKDQPLTAGSRIRFVLDPEDRSKDVVAYIENGALHVRGCYRMLDTLQSAVNAIDVIAMPWPKAAELSDPPTREKP